MPDNTKSGSSQTSEKEENSVQNDPRAAAKGNACPVCEKLGRPPGPCRGHADGGGGSEETATADQGDGQALTSTSGQVTSTVSQVANVAIENNRDSGIISIKLHCSPNSLSEEQRNELRKFVNTILKELDEFKKEKGISANCVTIDKDKGNFLSLRITLPTPTPTIYDAFIQRLNSKYLLPTQNIEQNKKQEGKNYFHSTPLSMKPTPNSSKKNGKSMDEDELKEEERKNALKNKK
ncbi:MAG TPA: hypothetical protein VLG12_00570 [Candidatus Saccharimonadales bacterium]|nr:hypothetical protein [Candidatus Saccharimonadales bacterium]